MVRFQSLMPGEILYTLSYDGTYQSLYIDRELETQILTANSPNSGDERSLFIGVLYTVGEYLYDFNGELDEIRIYNRAISETEIKARLFKIRPWKFNFFRISPGGMLSNDAASGVAEAQHFSDLIKGFTGSVIPCAAHAFQICMGNNVV